MSLIYEKPMDFFTNLGTCTVTSMVPSIGSTEMTNIINRSTSTSTEFTDVGIDIIGFLMFKNHSMFTYMPSENLLIFRSSYLPAISSGGKSVRTGHDLIDMGMNGLRLDNMCRIDLLSKNGSQHLDITKSTQFGHYRMSFQAAAIQATIREACQYDGDCFYVNPEHGNSGATLLFTNEDQAVQFRMLLDMTGQATDLIMA